MQAESFSPPPVRIGDSVYWYHDPLTCSEPTLGWVVQRPGAFTVTILTFSPNFGFLEKPSVRHKDDPGLQENADWRQWGCWEYSPQTAQMQKLDGVIAQLARKQISGSKNG